ncbi:MAG: hypothetical protein SX243_11150 [Acidobacteriota bacterium]|nr:hypothetical protein [Acidobacteriota bacterium]
MKKSLIVGCIAIALLWVSGVPVFADAYTPSQNGLSFDLVNKCDGIVSGIAVGDKVCLLKIGSAFFMSTVFSGDMASGDSQWASACTNIDGEAKILFVPSPSCGTQAVEVTVKANETVAIPSNFCACATGDREDHALKMGD